MEIFLLVLLGMALQGIYIAIWVLPVYFGIWPWWLSLILGILGILFLREGTEVGNFTCALVHRWKHWVPTGVTKVGTDYHSGHEFYKEYNCLRCHRVFWHTYCP